MLRAHLAVLLDLCVAAIGLAVLLRDLCGREVLVRRRRAGSGDLADARGRCRCTRSIRWCAFLLAYLLSLVFAVGYGYIAAYNKRVEAFMIAALDILQSIPVLSFLPAVMLAMVALFPTRQLGMELGAILLIFTGASVEHGVQLLLVAEEHSARAAGGCGHQPLLARGSGSVQLELPFAAIGLVWNSMVSVAAGGSC